MQMLLSVSARTLGDLYHATSLGSALSILRTGMLGLSTGRLTEVEDKHQRGNLYFASFTRSRVGGYHFDFGYKTNTVILTIDGTALSHNNKIVPVDYFSGEKRKTEAEERLISNKPSIEVLNFIKRVDILQKPNAQERGIASLVLQLKKQGIPYSFYANSQDWMQRRGEYYPTEMTAAKPKNSVGDKYTYSDLFRLYKVLRTDIADLDPKTRELCYDAARYGRDALIQGFFNARSAKGTGALRDLTHKVAKLLDRNGIHSPADFNKYIADRYKVYEREVERKKYLSIAERSANSIINLMTTPTSELSEEERSWLSPKFDDMLDTKISYYLGHYVEDFGHTPVTRRAYELLRMDKLDAKTVLDKIRQLHGTLS